MLKLLGDFKINGTKKVPFPNGIRNNKNFWCSLNTEFQLIMCRITYLGNDEEMKPDIWYNGQFELPYGDLFYPFGKQFEEEIRLHYTYRLHVAEQMIGECHFNEIVEIIKDSFSVEKNLDGSI